MSEHQDPEGAEVRRLLEGPTLGPDLGDLHRRLRRREAGRRWAAGAVGLAIGCLAVVVAIVALERPTSAPRQASATTVEPLDGRLLVRPGPEIVAVPDASVGGVVGSSLVEGSITGYMASPDGSTLVGTLERREASGITRQHRIVLIDTTTGETSTLLNAGPMEGFAGPFDWSGDGRRIAFRRATWSVDPTKRFPGEPERQSPCVVLVATGATECFEDVSPVFGLDLASDGTSLLVDGGLRAGVRMLDINTGAATDLVPPGGSREVRDALSELGFLIDRPIQFLGSSWSASGAFVSTVARAEESDGGLSFVPMVVNRDGQLVTVGQPNVELGQYAWSPSKDILAYSTGLVGPDDPSAPPHEVRSLDPLTEADELILSTDDTANVRGSSDPFILSLVWSPEGAWLAVGGRDEVRIVDMVNTGDSSPRVMRPYEGEEGRLIDWVAG